MWRTIFFVLVIVFGYHCSEDKGPVVDTILLTVNKEVALSNGDSVLITTQVLSEIDERLQGIELRYFADELELSGPVFYPTEVGTLRISARYEDVVSTKVDVRVISLEDNISSLELVYAGSPYLTTEDWSVSGDFTFKLGLDNAAFPVTTNDIDLLLDGVAIDQRSEFHFDEAGTYSFEASFGALKSTSVTLEVREALDLEEVVIPVIFHGYGVDITGAQVQSMLDTLNSSFSAQNYSLDGVLDGLVNPNATDMKMRFVGATEAPPGATLSGLGIHNIEVTGNPFLDSRGFEQLAELHTWDPQQYVNYWLLSDFEFEEPFPRGYDDFGRGFASVPNLFSAELDGLVNDEANVPDNIAGIVTYPLSVFGEHVDYVVGMMGNYYGLFQTFNQGCLNEGDYCPDTHTIDWDADFPPGYFVDCRGVLFKTTNYLAFAKKRRDFTYDQALRMRTVIEHGISRVGGQ